MRRPSRQVRDYVRICECYHAGFNATEISRYIGKRITFAQVDAALEWEHSQMVLRSEIQAMWDALIETRELKKKANIILDRQLSSVTGQVAHGAVRDVERLIEAEVHYASRIRELSGDVAAVPEFADFGSLPRGIFSADLEPPGSQNDS